MLAKFSAFFFKGGQQLQLLVGLLSIEGSSLKGKKLFWEEILFFSKWTEKKT